jgi:hypothetical protein
VTGSEAKLIGLVERSAVLARLVLDLKETAPVAGLAPEAQFDAIVEAYLRINETVDRERGTRVGRPPIEVTRVRAPG